MPEGPPQLSSAWRKGVLRDGETRCPDTLLQARLPASERTSSGACAFAVHPSGDACCLGSCAPAKLQGSIGVVSLSAASDDDSAAYGDRRGQTSPPRRGSRHEHRRMTEVRLGHPVRSLSWQGSTCVLAAGTSEGKVVAWRCTPDSAAAALSEPPHVYTIPKLKLLQSVPPFDWAYSPCVGSVSVSIDGERILGTENSKVHVWSTAAQKEKGHVKLSASRGVLLCSSWSPLHADLFTTGSAGGGARLYDLRVPKPLQWHIPQHMQSDIGAIRVSALSPLVDHWLATAEDGGGVRVWDIRAGSEVGPVVRVPASALTVGAAWSPLHAELLALQGADGAVRLASLRQAPVHTIGTVAPAESSSGCGVGFVQQRGTSFVAAGFSPGDVLSVTVSSRFLERIAPRKPGGAADCPTLAFCRDFEGAVEIAKRDCVAALQDGRPEDGLACIEALRPHTFAPLDGPTRADVVRSFAADLEGCSRQLPPRLRMGERPRQLRELELNLREAVAARDGDWEGVAQRSRHLAGEGLRSLHSSVYESVVTALLRHSWTTAADFFLRTAPRLVKEVTGWTEQASRDIAQRLLGPLLFTPPDGLAGLLRELQLLVNVSNFIASPTGSSPGAGGHLAMRLLEVVEQGRGPECAIKVASGATLRCYANALLECDLAALIWVQDAICQAHPESSVAEALRALREREVDDRYGLKVDRWRVEVEQGAAGDKEVKKLAELCQELSCRLWRLVLLSRSHPGLDGPDLCKMVAQISGWLAELHEFLSRLHARRKGTGQRVDLRRYAELLGSFVQKQTLPEPHRRDGALAAAEREAQSEVQRMLALLRAVASEG
eukprot:TRINITY_DN25685_c0_g1_i1.p1 TRINITY_DN25685_c0_g1~~TRINITY_DN25685_c0_g1_i1.p1  ORF type:complete len:832 (+),score=217.72 TRINITY_DN25685_c0_g1_i1:48-2543(+)